MLVWCGRFSVRADAAGLSVKKEQSLRRVIPERAGSACNHLRDIYFWVAPSLMRIAAGSWERAPRSYKPQMAVKHGMSHACRMLSKILFVSLPPHLLIID